MKPCKVRATCNRKLFSKLKFSRGKLFCGVFHDWIDPQFIFSIQYLSILVSSLHNLCPSYKNNFKIFKTEIPTAISINGTFSLNISPLCIPKILMTLMLWCAASSFLVELSNNFVRWWSSFAKKRHLGKIIPLMIKHRLK